MKLFQINKSVLSAIILSIPFAYTIAQNVGINQPNPLWPLDITGSHGVIRVVNTTSNYGSTLELKNNSAAAEYMGVINFNDAGNSYPGQISYKSNHSMSFRVGQSERMMIDNNGRIGIGTQTPAFLLDIHADEPAFRVKANSVFGASLYLTNTLPNSLSLGEILFVNYGGLKTGRIIYRESDQMEFWTDQAERLSINYDGLVGINISPSTNRLEVSGNASKSWAGDWIANSDARLKKNIKPLESQVMLDKVLKLQGVTYEWNDDKTGNDRPEGIQYGFIAQNIQEAFPTLVEEDNLGYLQTAYGTYDPMMVEAIRALNEKIKVLENEIEKLKSDAQRSE